MKYALLTLLLVAFNASATNPPNPCGNHGNNCQPGDSGGNSSSDSSSSAGAVGFGFGLGTGGNVGDTTSTANGGDGGDGGNGYGGNAVGIGGSGGHSSSAVKDSGNSANFNANTAKGGNAHQGQSQGQSLNSANLVKMASENTAVLKNQNANQSSANGNTTVTNVGGDSTLVERNAPPVFLGALTPTSCGGGFNAGGSSRDGAGAFGIQWVGKECRMRMIGDRYQALGMVDTACEVYKATKGFKDAAKANPKLRDLDCTIKPVPASVVAPAPVLVAPELAPRLPRG